MRPEAAYAELIKRAREETLLASCAELLGWDELTYMPRGGAANRGNQMAFLAGLQHERATDPRLGELLGVIEGSDLVRDPFAPEAVNVRELRRIYERLNPIPRALVEELARVTSLAQQEWLSALENADFALFRPWLEKVLALKRAEAECLPRGTLYDALLDEYEPGLTTPELTALLDALRDELVPLVIALT